jgi:hypothetical protein
MLWYPSRQFLHVFNAHLWRASSGTAGHDERVNRERHNFHLHGKGMEDFWLFLWAPVISALLLTGPAPLTKASLPLVEFTHGDAEERIWWALWFFLSHLWLQTVKELKGLSAEMPLDGLVGHYHSVGICACTQNSQGCLTARMEGGNPAAIEGQGRKPIVWSQCEE